MSSFCIIDTPVLDLHMMMNIVWFYHLVPYSNKNNNKNLLLSSKVSLLLKQLCIGIEPTFSI